MEEGPEDHDNPFIFKRSGRKSQVTLCRNSSELQPGVCGSSCQWGLSVNMAWVSAAHGGPEGLGPRDPAPGPLQQERGLLATGPPWKFLDSTFKDWETYHVMANNSLLFKKKQPCFCFIKV